MITMRRKLIGCLVLCMLSAHVQAERKITIQGLFNNTAAIVVDGKQHILKVGKPSPEGIVLISANSREAVMEIDGQRGTYALGQYIGSTYTGLTFAQPAAGETVTIAPDDGGHYEVNGSINGFRVRFLVDTGATSIAMNRNEAKRLGIDYKRGRQGLSETASGIIKSYNVGLRTVKVGNIKLSNIKGTVIDSSYFPSIVLLGNTFLDHVNIVREGRLMELKARR